MVEFVACAIVFILPFPKVFAHVPVPPPHVAQHGGGLLRERFPALRYCRQVRVLWCCKPPVPGINVCDVVIRNVRTSACVNIETED